MEEKKQVPLPAPLFRDPIYDCPTDPTVLWNEQEGQWYLFYTQRRASDIAVGVSWVHGSGIGVATSADGAKWLYRGTLPGLEIEPGHNTFWAPEILFALGRYHMYVSYVTGIPVDWEYPRKILHYTSEDLWHWTFEGPLDLCSERVIDACVYEIAPHRYKLWYKDESAGSYTYAAVSEDLYDWRVVGREIDDCAQEGPNVFVFQGEKWLIADRWQGLAVYRSKDFAHWQRCGDILAESGVRPMDRGFGHHADVVVRGERAYIFYFCHPYAAENEGKRGLLEGLPPRFLQKAVVQAAELRAEGGRLLCDRTANVFWAEGA